MAETMPPMPLSAEAQLDAMNREGYYEWHAKLAERRIENLSNQNAYFRLRLSDLDAALHRANDEITAWRDLAVKYGTRTEAEKRRNTMTLKGDVEIDVGLLYRDGSPRDVILYACANLAKRMQAEFAAKRTQELVAAAIATPTGPRP